MADSSENQKPRGDARIEVSDSLQAFVDFGRTLSSVRWIGDRPFALAPRDTVMFDLEAFAQKPARKRGTVTVDRVQSLARYVNTFGGKDGSTMAFADVKHPKGACIHVVLDYHTAKAGEARWCDHEAIYQMTQTREWKEWLRHDGKRMSQMEFAEFLEDRMVDIADPPAADVYSLVRTLEAKRQVNFRSATRQEDGSIRVAYDEEIETRGGSQKGQVDVPSELTLAIRPFEGMDKWKLQVRLRYRLNEGSITFWYQIVEPDRVREACFEEQVGVFEKAVNLECIRGSVEIAKPSKPQVTEPNLNSIR